MLIVFAVLVIIGWEILKALTSWFLSPETPTDN